MLGINVSMIPSEWDPLKWLQYAEATNILFLEPTNEVIKGPMQGKSAGTFNQMSAQGINLEMGNYITQIIYNVPSGELITCASAFNGFAIYKLNKFVNCNYDGRLRLDLIPFKQIFNKNNILNDYFNISLNSDCEHRSFHFEAIRKNNAKIRISSDILFK